MKTLKELIDEKGISTRLSNVIIRHFISYHDLKRKDIVNKSISWLFWEIANDAYKIPRENYLKGVGNKLFKEFAFLASANK